MPEAIATPSIQRGHSAMVEMTLTVGGVAHRVSQSGRGFLILEQSAVHPPSLAEFCLEIDGKESRRTVFLPDGIQAGERRVRTEPIRD